MNEQRKWWDLYTMVLYSALKKDKPIIDYCIAILSELSQTDKPIYHMFGELFPNKNEEQSKR